MNYVVRIRGRKKIAQIKNLLRGQGRFRDLLLFTVGVSTALRISDLLQFAQDEKDLGIPRPHARSRPGHLPGESGKPWIGSVRCKHGINIIERTMSIDP
jgi:hypothetical protein